MSSEVLVTVLEDVLAIENTTIDRHVKIYNGLKTQFRTVVLTSWPRDDAKQILKLRRVTYDILADKGTSVLGPVDWKVQKVRELLGMGWPIGLYLDTDVDTVRQVFQLGISTMLLSHRMSRPAWMPSDGPPREWESVVAFAEAADEAEADDADLRRSRSPDWALEVE